MHTMNCHGMNDFMSFIAINPYLPSITGKLRIVFVIFLVLVVTACTTSPDQPDFLNNARQQSQSVSHWINADNTEAASHTALNQLINTPVLAELITQALAANPNLQQILLTLQIRQAERRQTFGQRLPQVEAGLNTSKSETATGTESSEQTDTRYTGSINISWEVDLWGKLANSDYAMRKDIQQQAWLVQAARDSLVAQICQVWLSLVAQQHSIGIRQAQVLSLDKNQQFIATRYRSGLGSLEDLDSIQTNLASAKATLESERELKTQLQRSLAVLLGTSHLPSPLLIGDYPEVLVPLAELPQQTLQRRPDLQAAYSAIEAADLRRKVAYKDLLPSINLSATLEDAANSPRQALLTNPLWSLLGQLTAPLYQGGQLKAAVDIADLEVAQSYQNYRSSLLTAVNEVEDALSLQNSLDIQYQHISNAVTNSQRNLEQYRQKYRVGLANILDVLSVEQQTFDLQAQQDDLLLQRLSNRIDLGLALGLSWEINDHVVNNEPFITTNGATE